MYLLNRSITGLSLIHIFRLINAPESLSHKFFFEIHFGGVNPVDGGIPCLLYTSQTSGGSLTEQDPFNNVGRTCIEAMAAAL